MTKHKIKRTAAAIAMAGIPLVTQAVCDPATGYFDFYRDDDADYCCDDFDDSYYYDDDPYYYDDPYYDDCFLFFCF